MPNISAGILMYRITDRGLQVFLVHPGGPLWAEKDLGAWSIPKGLLNSDEDPLAAARREFEEETGFKVSGDFIPLCSVTTGSGKVIQAWAVEGDCDASAIKSNTFPLEWPPRSGRYEEFPEVDRAEWFDMKEAKKKINKRQAVFLEELAKIISKI